jgi:hypothetical protein
MFVRRTTATRNTQKSLADMPGFFVGAPMIVNSARKK